MSVQLLDKTRKINKLLHNNNSHKVVFNDICDVLSDILASNAMVISKKGKILGLKNREDIPEIHELIEGKVGSLIDNMLNERLLLVLSTKENVNLTTLGFDGVDIDKYHGLLLPIDIAGERLGTLFLYRLGTEYDIDDIILGEYGTTVVGLEMMRALNEENAEENRKIAIVRSAISTLSFSELQAIKHIFSELDGEEGILYEKEFHGKMFRDNEVAFVFVYQKPVDIADLTIQKEELDGVSWFDLEETYEACKNHDQKFCVPIGGLETVGKYLNEIIR